MGAFDDFLWGPGRQLLDAAGRGDPRAVAMINQLRDRYASQQAFMSQQSMMRPEMPTYMRIDAQTGLPEAETARQQFMAKTKPLLGQAKASQAAFGGGNSFAQQRTNDVQNAINKESVDVYNRAKDDSIRQHALQQKDWLNDNRGNMPEQDFTGSVNRLRAMIPQERPQEASMLPKVMGAIRGADNLLGNAPSNLLQRGGRAVGGQLNRLFFGDANQAANYFGGW